MGRAKKRFIRLARELREQGVDTRHAWTMAVDIDQRKQAALQAARWRAADPKPQCPGTGCEWCGDCRICDCLHKYGCDRLSVDQ